MNCTIKNDVIKSDEKRTIKNNVKIIIIIIIDKWLNKLF